MDDYRDHPEPRHDLPSRRLTQTRKITTGDGHTVFLSLGFDPTEDGRPREVFYSAGFRSGSQLEFLVQDACVLISLLLQHGHRADDIKKSLARVEGHDGKITYASLIGLVADELTRPLTE